jgi:predicted heme/steroid binding protein
VKIVKKLNLKILALLLISIVVLVGCSVESVPEDTSENTPVNVEELVLTVEELGEFDGMDGNPAYIAVDDVIYDVTNVAPWKGATHNGFSAGQDLTEEIKGKSPHGVTKLDGVPIVGRLED